MQAPVFFARLAPKQPQLFEKDLRHTNAPWVMPTGYHMVRIYVPKKDSYVPEDGYYDRNLGSWIKANGVAVKILGWEE